MSTTLQETNIDPWNASLFSFFSMNEDPKGHDLAVDILKKLMTITE
jgi:hypothetical protein